MYLYCGEVNENVIIIIIIIITLIIIIIIIIIRGREDIYIDYLNNRY